MDRPNYLSNYNFNWEALDVIVSGKSSLDADRYLAQLSSREEVQSFLKGYGFDCSDPVQAAELFGNFQEAIQFIKRYFLKEGNSDGLDLTIPNSFYSITDIGDLFLMATGKSDVKSSIEDSIWAGVILKVMHTILHTDKDLRYRYFSTIQQQIFDRFYKFIKRDDEENLYLESEDKSIRIPLYDFHTKSKKSRESIIIKLLHKEENVAEELFDRIGIRFVTFNKVDTIRVMRFLYSNYVIMVNNIKPSRSHNTLVNIESLKESYFGLLKDAMRDNYDEEKFRELFEALADKDSDDIEKMNIHSSDEYKAIHFTCRQLIKYKNPFVQEFSKARTEAKKDENSDLAKMILNLDTSSIARDVRFFYPYEIQITDVKSQQRNTEGEASHNEYKKSQLHSAMNRLFKQLTEYKNIELK